MLRTRLGIYQDLLGAQAHRPTFFCCFKRGVALILWKIALILWKTRSATTCCTNNAEPISELYYGGLVDADHHAVVVIFKGLGSWPGRGLGLKHLLSVSAEKKFNRTGAATLILIISSEYILFYRGKPRLTLFHPRRVRFQRDGNEQGSRQLPFRSLPSWHDLSRG